ncbi:MAG: COR domain-containing protein [Geminicoccaceae bacterium]
MSDLVPFEVLSDPNDPQAILAAYRRIAHGETRALNEAKLLVVGNEAVGKTSLLRYLIHGQPRDPAEEKTPGIATQEKIEIETWSPEAGDIRLNVWDFGGQEMMRGTHRFFLTARSLYLLVLEDRREDDRSIHDWLKTIKNRAGDAPILVVINKSDQGKEALRLDQKSLCDDYPEILGFFRTSCNDDDFSRETIEALREKIVDAVVRDHRMKHVRDLLPAGWLRIKDAVTDLAADQSVLPLSTFERLCATVDAEAEPVTDEDERRSLLRLLNDLGTIVAHGLEPDARAVDREITLLDPNWLTEAIYKILTSADCAELQGGFSRDHLTSWLDPKKYPPERHEFILNMMQKDEVGLCFPLPGSDDQRFLVPEALPANAPFYDNWSADCLRFRYRYDFLPRGLIPRFIVHAHDLLADPPTRWRTGAVFKTQDCPILVAADVDKKTIDILVDGPEKRRRAALGVIIHHLETIHTRNPEAEPTGLVPLPDQPERDEEYDFLLTLEQEEGPDYRHRPTGAKRAYTVAELLDGVRHEARATSPDGRAGAIYHVHGDPTFVQGDVETGTGDVQIGQQTNEVPAPASNGWADALTSWRFFSLAAAAVAVILANVLYWIESEELRLVIAGSAAIFVAIYLIVASFNPERFFRRLIARTVLGGLLINMGGFAFDAFLVSEPATGWLRWDGSVGIGFNIAWAVVVCALAFLERQRTKA